MGRRRDGGGTGRARRLGPVVAAIVGATAVAAAAALTRRRRGAHPAHPATTTTATAAGGRRPLTARPPCAGSPPPSPAATTPHAPDRTTADPVPTAPHAPDPATAEPAAVAAITDGPTVDDPASAGAGGAAPQRVAGRRRRLRLAAAIVAVTLVLGAGALVAGPGGDDPEADDPPTASTAAATTTAVPPVTAEGAFAAAAERLTAAGSFSYAGSVSATDVSHARPMFWLAVSSTVEGQVATSTHRLHEVAVAADGAAAETVADGDTVWGRRAPSVEALADLPFEPIPGLSAPRAGADDPALVPPARGAALLPAWLASATGPTAAGPDEQGRRRFQATIPAAVLGEIERQRPPVDATVVLTLDTAGIPVRVEITSAPDGPRMHLVFDITGLGAPVTIEPPA